MDISSVIQSRLSSFAANAPSRADVDPLVAHAIEGIDPATATEDDLIAIRDSLQEAGARPSITLAQSLKDAGFDPVAIRDAGRDTIRAPRLPGGGMAGMSAGQGAQFFDTLQTILADYEGQEITADDREDIATRLREQLAEGQTLSRFA